MEFDSGVISLTLEQIPSPGKSKREQAMQWNSHEWNRGKSGGGPLCPGTGMDRIHYGIMENMRSVIHIS